MRRKISKKITNEVDQKIWSLISCRVSSERQVKDGHGLESQKQRCKKYSDEKGYIYEKTFLDEGVSGAIFERPAIKQILEHIDKNPHKKYVVIFDDINRIARDIEVHWAIKKEFASRGAVVESPNFKFEDTPEGKFIETILAGKSQLDREQNKRQVMQKMKARLECGVWCFSAVPCGMEYKKTAEYGKLLHLKEPEASIIRDALEGFENDRFLTQVDVLNFLLKYKDEISDRRKINLNFVKRILTEIVYTGYIEYTPWGVARKEGHHEAIISIETYDRIQTKLQKAEKKITKRDNAEFPLRRLVYCSVCGKKMTGSKNRGKLGKYHAHYTCNNSACTANPKNIKKTILENAYVELLNKITPESEIIELTQAIAMKTWKDAIKGVEATEKAMEREIEAKERQIEDYINLMPKTASDIVRERYELKIEVLGNELNGLKNKTKLSEKLSDKEAISEVLHFIGTPSDYWQKTNLEGKFMVHDLIFTANLMFDAQNGFGTPEISLPFTIKDAFSNSVSSRVDLRRVELLTPAMRMQCSTN